MLLFHVEQGEAGFHERPYLALFHSMWNNDDHA